MTELILILTHFNTFSHAAELSEFTLGTITSLNEKDLLSTNFQISDSDAPYNSIICASFLVFGILLSVILLSAFVLLMEADGNQPEAKRSKFYTQQDIEHHILYNKPENPDFVMCNFSFAKIRGTNLVWNTFIYDYRNPKGQELWNMITHDTDIMKPGELFIGNKLYTGFYYKYRIDDPLLSDVYAYLAYEHLKVPFKAEAKSLIDSEVIVTGAEEQRKLEYKMRQIANSPIICKLRPFTEFANERIRESSSGPGESSRKRRREETD